MGFIAHVDTSPAVTGCGVTPVVHRNYQGGDITLPGDPTQVITVAQHPVLADLVGDDIITTDGTTLLGSDDKAGVAAIMTLVDTLLRNPKVPHGRVRVAFTADEEIGTGIEKFDVPGIRRRLRLHGGRQHVRRSERRDVECAPGDRRRSAARARTRARRKA